MFNATEAFRQPWVWRVFAALPHLALLAALLILWELSAAIGLTNEILVPRPSAIFGAIWELYIQERTIYWHFVITMWEAVAGFLIAASVAISLAVASALSDSFRRYVSPYAIVLNVTPGLALTPIIIAWFGFGISSKIALGAVISFFPIFVNALTGLSLRDNDREELFTSLGATKTQIFWKLRVKQSLPLVFAGFKIGMTTALIGAVVAEFTQATQGVGVLMQRFSFTLDMASSIATLLSMSTMGLILFTIMELLDDLFVYWRREARRAGVSRSRRAAWERRHGIPGNPFTNTITSGSEK